MLTTSDPIEQLKAEIEALASTAIEVWPEVAGVLFTLRGSMEFDNMCGLDDVVADFTQSEIERIRVSLRQVQYNK